MNPLRALAAAAALVCALPVPGRAQDRSCDLAEALEAQAPMRPDGTRVFYVVQPVFRCTDGAEIRADSAVIFEATSFSQFFRNVYMRDGTRVLESDRANYQDRVGRLDATGNVRVVDNADGTRMTGETLIFLQAGESRPEDVLTMEGGQPSARFTPRAETDSTGAAVGPPPEPVDLTARRIVLVGDRMVQARGLVHLVKDSLDAYGDSLAYDQNVGNMSLFLNARILAPRPEGDTLDLRGDTIITELPGGRIDRIEARRRTAVLGGDVSIRGPIAHLFFVDEELDRIVATVAPDDSLGVEAEVNRSVPREFEVAPRRPTAQAESYRITGDSLDIATPGGVLETVFATGRARAVSAARDSINTPDTPEILRQDWIEGDSIRAFFAAAEGDDAEEEDPGREIRRLVATGNARSLSRFRPDSVPEDRPDSARVLNANYVTGSEIRVFLVDGEVDDMEVDDADGVFLQPAATARIMNPDSTAAPADSAAADTSGVAPPDTTRRGGGGGGVPPRIPRPLRPKR